MPATRRTAGDLYLRLLACGLIGYAVLGKGFAYIGAPPLYVGEILFVLGLVVLLSTGCFLLVFTILPTLLLAALGIWVGLRTVPFLGIYGIDAVRDSVVVLYGCFGLITCALMIEKPARLNSVFRFFYVFASCFGPGGSILYYVSKITRDFMPSFPGSSVPLLFLRPGEVAVHVAGSAVFALLLFSRVGWVWSIMLLASIALSSAQSRGGMLAIVVPLGLAGIVSGRIRPLATGAMAGALVLGCAYAIDLDFSVRQGERALSAEQLGPEPG